MSHSTSHSKARARSSGLGAQTLTLTAVPPPVMTTSAARPKVGIYAATIFLSAFLLFQIQLVMGKFILPRFGGGPSVWSTSLLMFQLLLLAGYSYAALLCAKFDFRRQGRIHLSLLAVSAILIAVLAYAWRSPIFPAFSSSFRPSANPVWQILLLLVCAVGLPTVVLSATSPLMQRWFSAGHAETVPYRLYALSNLGSMLGLLSYPFFIERFLRLSTQAWIWSSLYAVFLIMAAVCAWLQVRRQEAQPVMPPAVPRRRKKQEASRPMFLWLALAACASATLLATTNLICQEITVVPLLWVLPLSVYLLSFVICFDHARWYKQKIFHPLYVVLTVAAFGGLTINGGPIVTQLVIVFCLAEFSVCMVCHGELARLKPEPQHLTSFYLMISLGGAVGSIFVVFLAPVIFDRFWEFQLALLAAGVLLFATLVRDKDSWAHKLSAGWLMVAGAAIVVAVGAGVFTEKLREKEGTGSLVSLRMRNFFGIKAVDHNDIGPYLVSGHTLHGLQNSDPATRFEPTGYYFRKSGIGLLLDNFPRPANRGLRVGVIGLGVGTLAAYGHPGDYYRFYEIDPDVISLSQGDTPVFTFLKGSAAKTEIVPGDARIRMQEEAARGDGQNFDVLVVDAFNSDSIPVHLLTREAMALYLRQLRGPESVIAFHVSSNAIDLQPLMAAISHAYQLNALEVQARDSNNIDNIWVLLARDPQALQTPTLASVGHRMGATRNVRLWTDDFSNVYELLVGW